MFDIGWSELLVIAVVAIVVVGPKELPRMLRTFGRTMGTVRKTANDFKRQFDEALREAEREAGLEDTKKQLKAIATNNPLAEARRDMDSAMRSATGSPATPMVPRPPTSAAQPAEPLKTGAAAEPGSDAA